jgi:hypothetical protein
VRQHPRTTSRERAPKHPTSEHVRQVIDEKKNEHTRPTVARRRFAKRTTNGRRQEIREAHRSGSRKGANLVHYEGTCTVPVAWLTSHNEVSRPIDADDSSRVVRRTATRMDVGDSTHANHQQQRCTEEIVTIGTQPQHGFCISRYLDHCITYVLLVSPPLVASTIYSESQGT